MAIKWVEVKYKTRMMVDYKWFNFSLLDDSSYLVSPPLTWQELRNTL